MRDSWSEEEVQLAALLRGAEREWPSNQDADRILLLAQLEGRRRRSLLDRVGARILSPRMVWAGAIVLLVTLIGTGATAGISAESATEWGSALGWLALGGAVLWISERTAGVTRWW